MILPFRNEVIIIFLRSIAVNYHTFLEKYNLMISRCRFRGFKFGVVLFLDTLQAFFLYAMSLQEWSDHVCPQITFLYYLRIAITSRERQWSGIYLPPPRFRIQSSPSEMSINPCRHFRRVWDHSITTLGGVVAFLRNEVANPTDFQFNVVPQD